MKTKTNILILTLYGMLFTSQVKSQFYLSAEAGWGFPAAKGTIGSNYDNNGTSTTYTGVYSSYGKGLQSALLFGYSVNDNVSLEAGYGYQNMMGQIATRDDYNNTTTGFSSAESFESGSSTHRFLTGIRLTAGEGDWKPYMRVAFVLGFGTKMDWYDHSSDTDNGNTSTSKMHYELAGGVSLGGAFGLGLSKNINDKLSFFIQGTFIYSSWAPLNAKLVEYTVDGQDMLPGMTTRDKETEFVDSYTYSGTTNDNEPDKEIKEYFPYSSAGLNLGIVLHF